MKLIIRQIEAALDYNQAIIINAVASRLGANPREIKNCEIIRRSLDARPWRKAPVYILSVEVDYTGKINSKKLPSNVELVNNKLREAELDFSKANKLNSRPVVVGAGPAGLMATLLLARAGARPILLERGSKAEDRSEAVEEFWKNGKLNLNNNVLYGEGGAGLFSDGKLTARSKDRRRIRLFFEELVKAGANPDILIDAEPHLGSDSLLKIVPNLRNDIISNGGEIRYNTALTMINIEDGKISSVYAGNEIIKTDYLLLGTGHSARDIYWLLASLNVSMEAKPTAIGIRLEVPQKELDKSQFRQFAGNPKIGAASYKLTRKAEEGVRACYSFCMCPGGQVIACANEENALTTNGMSLSKRNEKYGNAAFIVPVEPSDYASVENTEKYEVLSGISFQKNIEQKAFVSGGSNFSVPALKLKDYLAGKVSGNLTEGRSCSRSVPASFDNILPDFINKTLRHQIPHMLKELDDVKIEDAIVYAAETRSSSPVRILRDENCESLNIKGLFPIGEGAGYAGGIVSSAVDGMKAAEAVLGL